MHNETKFKRRRRSSFSGVEKIIIGVIVLIVLFFGLSFFGGLRVDFAGGSHAIIPTAVDETFWGHYRVYFRSPHDQFSRDQEEQWYYIHSRDSELAEQMRQHMLSGETVLVFYSRYVGLFGMGAPSSAPIDRIEIVERDGD